MRSSAIGQHLRDSGETIKAAFSSVKFKDSMAAACFRGLALTSHLQPIFSLAHQRAVGYEGLMRCTDRSQVPLSPLEAFARCRKDNDAVTMDQLSRALHLRNFDARGLGDAWLCINVDARAIRKFDSEDTSFGQLLEELRLPASRIVLVIAGAAALDEQKLKSWVDYHRGMGCLIALKAVADGHLDLDGIWRLIPDFVMLDRFLVAEAGKNPAARVMLPRIVSMLHETGALVVLQGIESGQEAKMAMDADVDFVQGCFFAPPSPTGEPREFSSGIEEMLAAAYRLRADAVAKAQSEMMARVQAEQQAIAEVRARAAAEVPARISAAFDRVELPYHPAHAESNRGPFPRRRLLSHLVRHFSDVRFGSRRV